MLVHPFHKIVDATLPGEIDDNSSSERWRDGAEVVAARIGRRGFFASLIAGGAGLLAFLTGRTAEAQWPRWERFDRRWDDWYGDRPITTQALGEEGSEYRWPPRPPRDRVTTYALGEEGSWYPPPRNPPPGRITTQALGEEGSGYWRPRPAPPPGRVTTFALGEEG